MWDLMIWTIRRDVLDDLVYAHPWFETSTFGVFGMNWFREQRQRLARTTLSVSGRLVSQNESSPGSNHDEALSRLGQTVVSEFHYFPANAKSTACKVL